MTEGDTPDLKGLQRDVRVLTRRLTRSEENRRQLELARDHGDSVLRKALDELRVDGAVDRIYTGYLNRASAEFSGGLK